NLNRSKRVFSVTSTPSYLYTFLMSGRIINIRELFAESSNSRTGETKRRREERDDVSLNIIIPTPSSHRQIY
ncbi:hypothetical protein CH063_14836, partial [Colletotrichum higginsianum]